MLAGTLRNTISIERLTQIEDDFGEVIENYSTLYEVRANVRPISSKEYISSNMEITKATHIFKIRYQLPLLNTSDSLIFNGNRFDIKSVINIDEKNKVLEIIANKIN